MKKSANRPEKHEVPSINWLESACRSLQAAVPETIECAPHVAERLSWLLLERLPRDLANDVLKLLPESESGPKPDSDTDAMPRRMRAVRQLTPRSASGERSVGYPAFVELTRHLLGETEILDIPRYAESEPEYRRLCAQVTDTFLWAVAQELPVEIKARMVAHLPQDLLCRMNLYCGYSARDKVA